jgi:hypothetical protein
VTFSLRLTADLAFGLAARLLGNARGHSPILHLSAQHNFDSALASSSDPEGSDHSFQSVARVSRLRAPIIWIGGSEPLDHPQVARFSNALAASGRCVFVETAGGSLKRRLHEFRPSSRLYFAVRFEGRQISPGRHIAGEAALRAGLEALRMARLAGFFGCAHLVLSPDISAGELEGLHSEILKLGVDGFLITSAAPTPELEKEVARLRRRLLSRQWALFSSLLQASLLPSASRTPQENKRHPLPKVQSESFGESAEAG